MHTLDLAIAKSADADNLARRIKAREKSTQLGRNCLWLHLVVAHHEGIEHSFAQLHAARDVEARRRIERDLRVRWTGHSVAEEAVLYPAMARTDQKAHALAAYSEHSQFKVRLALLSSLDAMSSEYEHVLERLRRAAQWHFLDEEGNLVSGDRPKRRRRPAGAPRRTLPCGIRTLHGGGDARPLTRMTSKYSDRVGMDFARWHCRQTGAPRCAAPFVTRCLSPRIQS